MPFVALLPPDGGATCYADGESNLVGKAEGYCKYCHLLGYYKYHLKSEDEAVYHMKAKYVIITDY